MALKSADFFFHIDFDYELEIEGLGKVFLGRIESPIQAFEKHLNDLLESVPIFNGTTIIRTANCPIGDPNTITFIVLVGNLIDVQADVIKFSDGTRFPVYNGKKYPWREGKVHLIVIKRKWDPIGNMQSITIIN